MSEGGRESGVSHPCSLFAAVASPVSTPTCKGQDALVFGVRSDL